MYIDIILWVLCVYQLEIDLEGSAWHAGSGDHELLVVYAKFHQEINE